jgi:hypothetical protein
MYRIARMVVVPREKSKSAAASRRSGQFKGIGWREHASPAKVRASSGNSDCTAPAAPRGFETWQMGNLRPGRATQAPMNVRVAFGAAAGKVLQVSLDSGRKMTMIAVVLVLPGKKANPALAGLETNLLGRVAGHFE